MVDGLATADYAFVRTPINEMAYLLAVPHIDVSTSSVETLRGYVHALQRVPYLAAAAALSGQDLDHALANIDTLSLKRLRSLAKSLTRLHIRMASRPTPFGVCAGIDLARFDGTRTAVGQPLHQLRIRPDLGWLSSLTDGLETDPTTWQQLQLIRSDEFFVRDTRVVVPQPPTSELTLRHSAIVKRALEFTASPVLAVDLLDRLKAGFPTAAPDQLESLIAQLIRSHVLVTDARPSLRPDAPPAAVFDAGSPSATGTMIADALCAIKQSDGATLDSTALDELLSRQRSLRDMRAGRSPLSVDLRTHRNIVLPAFVAAEAKAAADDLLRIAQFRPPSILDRCRAAFVDLYGIGQTVPLVDLVYGENAIAALLRRRAEPAGGSRPPNDRDQVMLWLAQRATNLQLREIELSDADLAALERAAEQRPRPRSFELGFELLAKSIAALTAGEFRLVVAPRLLSANLGVISGRFLNLFDGDALGEAVGDIRHAARAVQSGATPAQLVFRPDDGHIANVVRVPRILSETISIGEFGTEDTRLDDLLVGVEGSRFVVMRSSDGKVFEPRIFNALSTATVGTSSAAYFLTAMATQDMSPASPWTWGIADRMPFLPRIRRGRHILAAAQWAVPDGLSCRISPAWERQFAHWRAEWHVPRLVQLHGDLPMCLDLDNAMHRVLLRDEIRRTNHPVLREVVGTPADRGWIGGHVNQFVLPFFGQPDRLPATSLSVQPTPPQGSDWIYARLYGSPSRHDDIINLAVDEIAGDRKWFFVRYADDDGPHLRLRLHAGDDDAALDQFYSWLCAAERRGLIAQFAVSTYRPEYGRYGGADAMDEAETVFYRDSVVARGLLTTPQSGRPTIAVYNMVDIAEAFLATSWPQWFVTNLTRTDEHHRTRALREETVESLHTGRPVCDVARQQAIHDYRSRLDALWRADDNDERMSKILLSLLHMSCNRLDLDHATERRALAALRGVAERLTQQERFVPV